MNHLGTVTIETERLILRDAATDDFPNIFRYLFGDKKVALKANYKYYITYEDFLGSIQTGVKIDDYNWTIFLKESGLPIGNICVHTIDNDNMSCELGYALSYKYWNQGYMTEVLKEIINFLILDVGFNRVVAICTDSNKALGRVMEKTGMTYEGNLRESKLKDGQFIDKHVYATIKKDLIE